MGCMLLIEEKDAVQGKKIRTRSRSSVMIVIALSFLAVITMNIRQILSLSNARSDEIGTIQLDVIRSELQDIITEAETNVLRVAIGAEQLLESGASFETLTEYFNGQVEKYLSDKNFMNTYIAGSDWHIVPGFDAPEDFHAAERIWYLGAKDHPGEVFISEPYMDAKTGTMCFTVSTMLSDDETVVGMDLNFTKAQESILQMTQESDRTAMIVTEGGLIAGYTDMSLVGERADEKLTEYAEVYNREKVTLLRDYTGHYMVCLARKMDFGFTVLVANRCWDVYKSVFFVPIFLMVLFGVCLAFVVSLLNRLIRWQKVVNHQLVDAAKAAESANRAKSRFLSQMSHEIRTPMNAIIGLDNIALRDESISPGTRDNLEKINTSARHLLSLINDILDMSRIESGRMTLKEEPFSFRDFLDQICIIIHGQCQEKGLDFVCNRIGTFEDSYVGDDLKLRQVVINILGNSVKFTDPPGIVTFLCGTD